MSSISALSAREILDSRGNPTVEATVVLSDGTTVSASVPSGASTGSHEAIELRDNDQARYHGQGVLKAVANIEHVIAPNILGLDPGEQKKIDAIMCDLDGTKNKAALGANSILAVSLAVARAAAKSQGIPLYQHLRSLASYTVSLSPETFPIPMFNVINGGAHADSGLSVQEFKIVPVGIASYPEQLRAGSEIFHTLKAGLRKKGFTTDVGDEGGFAPRLESHSRAFDVLVEAVTESGYQLGKEIAFDIDAATDSFYNAESDSYSLQPENVSLKAEQMVALYKEWMNRYPLFSFEDPLHQDDFSGWHEFKKQLPKNILVIGDDLLVTNVERLQKAIEQDACNAVLIKINQIGTLTETLACMALAKEHDMKIIVSHRSGETTDDFIADLAVGGGADYIKTGSLSRGERLVKYNRLSAIYQELTA
jgi:enolase